MPEEEEVAVSLIHSRAVVFRITSCTLTHLYVFVLICNSRVVLAGVEDPREAKEVDGVDHPRAPRGAPPSLPSLLALRIASPRSSTNTSTSQSTHLVPMMTITRQASLEREVASLERDHTEAASPERVDGEEVESLVREALVDGEVDQESLERVEEEDGGESGLETDTSTTPIKVSALLPFLFAVEFPERIPAVFMLG